MDKITDKEFEDYLAIGGVLITYGSFAEATKDIKKQCTNDTQLNEILAMLNQLKSFYDTERYKIVANLIKGRRK